MARGLPSAHRIASVTEAIAAECLLGGLLRRHGIACGSGALAAEFDAVGWTRTEVARCWAGGGSVAVRHEGSASGVCGHCGVVSVVAG